MQPGETITPGNQPQPIPRIPVEQPATPAQPAPEPPVEQPETNTAPPETANFQPEQDDAPTFEPREPLTWTASEFVEHQKPHGWYALLGAAAVVIAAVVYFLTHDTVTVVVVILVAVMFGVVGARKPRSMTYMLSQTGLQIGTKTFPYASFKSFAVIEEGAMNSVQLLPLKRLVPPISLYFPPEQEQEIVETLADYLPHEDRDHDAIDRLMRRLHF